jgi:cytochrome c-type biogenesis protein CcmH
MLLATLLLGLFIVMGAFIHSDVAFAQVDSPTTTPVQEKEPAAQATEPAKASPDQVDVVARQLWCPLCNGVRLDACELKACDQMKDLIAVKLAAGEDAESIKAYFVQQYGPQVTGEPPQSGFNWLAWLLPGLAAVVGGYFFWRSTQRMMQPAPLPPSDETTPSSASASAKPSVGQDGEEEDEYTRKLEEELSKYG